MKQHHQQKLLAENRRARFDYEILETHEAGIELTGQEVKSAKSGRINLSGSHAVLRDGSPRRSHGRSAGELWLLNSQIPAYQPKNAPADYDPARSRRLLLHKEETAGLIGKLHNKSVSLIPLSAYVQKNFIKIELGLGRARKKSDKRELLKKRTMDREIQRGAE